MYGSRLLPILAVLLFLGGGCSRETPSAPEEGVRVALADSVADPGSRLPLDPPPVVLVPPEYPIPDDPPDTTDVPNPPPTMITDLHVVHSSTDRLVLEWTAPMDRGGTGGVPTEYDLRIVEEEFVTPDPENWPRDESTPPPGQPGYPDSHEVTGLHPGVRYVIRMRAGDALGSWGAYSNRIVHRTTHHRSPPVWVGNIGEAGPVLVSPRGIAVTPDGIVLVSDSAVGYINLYRRDGTYLSRFSPGADSTTISQIAADPDGTILVAQGSRVGRFTTEGELLYAHDQGNHIVSVSPGSRIALGIAGGCSIYDSNFNFQVNLVNWIGSQRDPYPRFGLTDIAWLNIGDLLGIFRDGIMVFYPTNFGEGERIMDPDNQPMIAAGVAAFPGRAIYLSDAEQRRGVVLDLVGNPIFEWPVPGSATGSGSDLGRIAVGPDESIFIIDLAAGLVRVFAYED